MPPTHRLDTRGGASPVATVLFLCLLTIIGITLLLFASSIFGPAGSSSLATVDITQNGIVSDTEQSATVTITYLGGTSNDPSATLEIRVNGQPLSRTPGVRLEHDGLTTLVPGEGATLIQTTSSGLTQGDVITVVIHTNGATHILAEQSLIGPSGQDA